MRERLTTFEGLEAEYTALLGTLETLTDKTRHSVMVPFGPKAFMPGQLVHTNELSETDLNTMATASPVVVR